MHSALLQLRPADMLQLRPADMLQLHRVCLPWAMTTTALCLTAALSQTLQTQQHTAMPVRTWFVFGYNACRNVHAALLQLCPADMLQLRW
jgi:hypothetical protein